MFIYAITIIIIIIIVIIIIVVVIVIATCCYYYYSKLSLWYSGQPSRVHASCDEQQQQALHYRAAGGCPGLLGLVHQHPPPATLWHQAQQAQHHLQVFSGEHQHTSLASVEPSSISPASSPSVFTSASIDLTSVSGGLSATSPLSSPKVSRNGLHHPLSGTQPNTQALISSTSRCKGQSIL